MAGSSELELKRLGFVKSGASAALTKVEAVYKAARGFVPAALEAQVASVEDAAAATAAPLVARANDKVADLLVFADGKVDGALTAVSSTLDYSRELHAKNMGSFASAKDAAYAFVESYVNATKAALDPQRYLDLAASLGKSVVDAIAGAVDPDKAAALAAGAFDKATSYTPVSKALELADPLLTVGQSQYAKAHDIIVVQPLYKKLYDALLSLPAAVSGTALYRKGYPLVAPVADPVISNFANSKVLKQLDNHLKPKTA